MTHSDAKTTVRAVLLVLTLIGVMQTVALAQSANSREDRIVGVWDVRVSVRNCNNPQVELSHFQGLHKYELGGTVQVVPSTNPTALSSHVGVWKAIEKNLYQASFKMFRFDSAGNNIGWTVVKNDVAITDDGTGYVGLGRAESFDLNGNSLGATCPTFIGTRFE